MCQPDYFPDAKEIAGRLVEIFGRPTLGNKRNPFDELVYVVLATKTPPERYQQIYRELRRRYPKADDLAEATLEGLARVIRPAGFAAKRASQLIEIAKRLRELFGRVTLSPLRAMSNKEAEALLVNLPGVGIKMARCILMYSLDREVFPVDNHCFRISKRLGWISPDATYIERQMNYLESHIPPDVRRDLHVGMVVLGRRYCFKNDPNCEECPILQYCSTGQMGTASRF